MRITKRCLLAGTRCLLGALLLASPTLPAQSGELDLEAIETDLAGPVQVLLENGNRQTGRVVTWDGENLQLEVQMGSGSAKMQFAADQIRDINLPGSTYLDLLHTLAEDSSRVSDALALYRAFYKQRGPYLRYMDADERDLFVRYARFALSQGEPLMAVSVINVLRPYVKDEALLKSLEDDVLLGLFLGGMREEAEAQAREWIAATSPSGRNALGWRILAEIHFQEEQYEAAFWTALQPLAFSNQLPTEHLDACYGFAVAAADAMHEDILRDRLHREMRARALDWPKNIPLLSGREPVWNESPNEGAEPPAEGENAGSEAEVDASPETTEPASSDEEMPAPDREPPKSQSPTQLPSRLP